GRWVGSVVAKTDEVFEPRMHSVKGTVAVDAIEGFRRRRVQGDREAGEAGNGELLEERIRRGCERGDQFDARSCGAGEPDGGNEIGVDGGFARVIEKERARARDLADQRLEDGVGQVLARAAAGFTGTEDAIERTLGG